MEACFRAAAQAAGGTCEITTTTVYEAWSVGEEAPISRRFSAACGRVGIQPVLERACGGSDASFLSAHGIACLVLATGMHEIHSVREYTTMAEMETMAQVVYHLILEA
jgi:tripeptide aminopeptidase